MDLLVVLLIITVALYISASLLIAHALTDNQLIKMKKFQARHIPALFLYFFWAFVFWPKIAYKRFTKQPW